MKFKNRFLQFGIFSAFFALTACGGGNQQKGNSKGAMPSGQEPTAVQQQQKNATSDMHRQHNSLAENFAHKNIVILDEVYQLNEQTQAELEEVIDGYLRLKNTLVNDDINAADKAIVVMVDKINNVKPESLDGNGLDAWRDHITLYKDKLQEMQHATGMENKRSYFSHISEIMYCTIKSFGLKQGDLYAIFCPMAFDGKGAYWISDSKIIQNPYMGAKMPKCGEVKENL